MDSSQDEQSGFLNDKANAQSAPEEKKSTPILVYTDSSLIWGNSITNPNVRISTLLRLPEIPPFIDLHEANLLKFGGNQANKPLYFPVLHIPLNDIIAYHIKPPLKDPLDYSPDEPMRKMEPVTALVGYFRFDGVVRMSTHSNLERYLQVLRESFISMYEVEITQPFSSSQGVMRIPFVLLRSERVIYADRLV